jgi:hypothetical protein
VFFGALLARFALRHGWIADDRFDVPQLWTVNGREVEWAALAGSCLAVLAIAARNRHRRGAVTAMVLLGFCLAGWSALSHFGRSEADAWWVNTKQRLLWRGLNGEGLEVGVYKHGVIIVHPDGRPVRLVNNPHARNPSWSQLESFLLQDDTDKHVYIPGGFVCSSYAEMLHNRSEAAGYRCAFVTLNLPGGHACNAFDTTDQGRIFVDCTGNQTGRGPERNVCIVNVAEGGRFCPVYLFDSEGWTCQPMGIARDVGVHW